MPEEDGLAALCLVFKKGAEMCMCSGVKFYSDPNGITEIYAIQSGNTKYANPGPILFD